MPPRVPHTEHFQAQHSAKTVPPHAGPEEGSTLEENNACSGGFCVGRFDGTACYTVRQRFTRRPRQDRSDAVCRRRTLAAAACTKTTLSKRGYAGGRRGAAASTDPANTFAEHVSSL